MKLLDIINKSKILRISKWSGILLLFILVSAQCQPKAEKISTEIYTLTDFFKACEVEGSIAIFDQQNNRWILSDSVGIYQEYLPASTFKILNLLIALEVGAIEDEHEVIQFPTKVDTTRYGYRPGTYRDMSVAEGFEASAVWVFLELAERIGKDTYRQYLKKVNYGNQVIIDDELDFWNLGELGISPVDQVKFMADLYHGNLPFSKRNMDIVKEVMLSEVGNGYQVHSKTGWTRAGEINTGWWVGYVEKGEEVYFFATLILKDRNEDSSNFGNCRRTITENIFEHLDLLN